MTEINIIEIKEDILSDNKDLADLLRAELKRRGIFMLNLMSSPGAGKTSLILETIRRLHATLRIGIIEGDIASSVDAEKVALEGVPAVQLQTGGFCHLDAAMIEMALKTLDLSKLDLIIIENVGNLVCPAEFDTGANKNAMILSIPEGDDKPLKYPLMFSVSDALIINKMDYLSLSDFNIQAFRRHARRLNPDIRIFEVSCRTGEGISDWIDWLRETVEEFSGSSDGILGKI